MPNAARSAGPAPEVAPVTTPDAEGASDARRLAAGTGHNLLATLGRCLIPLFYVIAGRRYGEASFGLFALLYVPIELLVTLTSAGLGDAVVRFGARDPGAAPTFAQLAVLRRCVVLVLAGGALAVALVAVLAQPLCGALWDRPDAAWPLVVLAFNVPLLGLLAVVLAACRAVLDMKGDLLVGGVVAPLGLVALALAFHAVPGLASVWGLVLAITASNALALGVALGYARRHYRLRALLAAPPTSARVLAFAIPQGATMVLWTGLWSSDVMILATVAPDATLGLYRVASEAARAVISARYVVSDVYTPLVARLVAEGARARISREFARLSRWVGWLALPVAVLIYLLRAPILGAVSPLYPAAAGFLGVLLVGPLINALTGLAGNTLAMTGHVLALLAAQAVAFVVNVAVDLALVGALGALGSAIGTSAALVTLGVSHFVLAHRLVGLRPSTRALVRPLGAALVATGLAALVVAGGGGAIASALGFVAVYVGLGAVLAPVEDRALLPRWRASLRP